MPRPLPMALACALAAVACARNPVTRRPEFVLVSRASEVRLGEREARRVAQEMGLVEDPRLTDYVSAVGARLAAHAPRQDVEYQFHVVDSALATAFALPGGYVYVTRGLLALLDSEDELAGVIGHEIGHVAARHVVQRLTRAAPLALATHIPAAAVGLVLPRLGETIGSLGQFANSLVLAPYGRSQELQADRTGQELAAASGWDPRALASLLHTLQRQQQLGDAGARASFLDTHPLESERESEAERYAAQLERAAPAPIAPDRVAFLERLDGLLVGPNPADGAVEGNAFLQPDLDLWVRLPPGWKAVHGREFVVARAPDGSASLVLQLAAESGDALEVARDFAQREGALFGLIPVAADLGSQPGARAVGRTRGATVDVSWLSYGGRIYQVTGVCRSRDYEALQTPFIDVALSLRPLSASERAGFWEDRLRLVEAREGETLQALTLRSGSRWSAEQEAVANALGADAPLAAGQRIKVAIRQRYAAH
jgi:predicted Zn-dependent protease